MKLVKKVNTEEVEAWDPKTSEENLPDSFKEFKDDGRLIFETENTGLVLNRKQAKKWSENVDKFNASSDEKFDESKMLLLLTNPQKRLMIVDRETIEKRYEEVREESNENVKNSDEGFNDLAILQTIIRDYEYNGNAVERKTSRELEKTLFEDEHLSSLGVQSKLNDFIETGNRSYSATSRKILVKFSDMKRIFLLSQGLIAGTGSNEEDYHA